YSMKHTPRPLSTPRQRLQWLVNFASADLTTMREGDLLNTKQELADLLLPLHSSLAPGGLHLWPDTEPTLFPLVERQALQDELRDELAFALARREQSVEREQRQVDHVPFYCASA